MKRKFVNCYFTESGEYGILNKKVSEYLAKAKSGDYNNLLEVTKEYVGDMIQFTDGN